MTRFVPFYNGTLPSCAFRFRTLTAGPVPPGARIGPGLGTGAEGAPKGPPVPSRDGRRADSNLPLRYRSSDVLCLWANQQPRSFRLVSTCGPISGLARFDLFRLAGQSAGSSRLCSFLLEKPSHHTTPELRQPHPRVFHCTE